MDSSSPLSAQPLRFTPPTARADRRNGRRLRRAFARADDPGPLPRIAEALMERLDGIRLQPERILDLGGRCGAVAPLALQKWPGASLIRLGLEPTLLGRTHFRRDGEGRPLGAVAADPERLPLPPAQFDLILSNMLLHWSGDLAAALGELHRTLRPGGLLLFTVAGAQTGAELAELLATAPSRAPRGPETDGSERNTGAALSRPPPLDGPASRPPSDAKLQVAPERAPAGPASRPPSDAGLRMPAFPEIRQLGDLLTANGFALPVVDRERVTLNFSGLLPLLRALKRLGAGNFHHQSGRHQSGRHPPRPGLAWRPGLAYRNSLADLEAEYVMRFPASDGGGGIRFTAEILFGIGWRDDSAPAACGLPPAAPLR